MKAVSSKWLVIKKKKLPLKTVYYLSFLFFIVIPILITMTAAFFVLNKQFKKQAIENIRQAQETIITELRSDIDIMSMRLSHLIYTNNNEILAYAAETDTSDRRRRYEYEQKLQQTGNLALEPVKDIISAGFYMKDGKQTYIKNEIRSLKLWLTNYFAWIMDYSASKLNVTETDVIVKAKRYMADNYEDAELSLSKVAEYVELNEKYFTNRFTRETGETFSSYLTALRMQKAKELLKTTTFKVYEISEMVGYHNVEHFNRMFKKLNDITPAQYRKTM